MSVFITQLSLSTLTEYWPAFQSFFSFLHHFVSAKLATSSIRVNSHETHEHLSCYTHMQMQLGLPRKSSTFLGKLGLSWYCKLILVFNLYLEVIVKSFKDQDINFLKSLQPWQCRARQAQSYSTVILEIQHDYATNLSLKIFHTLSISGAFTRLFI